MSNRKLLLADDSITIQKVVNLTFADEGIDVTAVGDGNTAMEKFVASVPDVVLVDVNMPGLDGYRICEMIKQDEETRHIPVILLVGSFEPFDEEEARRVGADDYLTKPFQSIRQLVGKVTALLDSVGDKAVPNGDALSASSNEVAENYSADEISADVSARPDSIDVDAARYGDAETDDEMIQTNQIGSLPADESQKFSSGFSVESFSETSAEQSSADDFDISADYETEEPDWSKPQPSSVENAGEGNSSSAGQNSASSGKSVYEFARDDDFSRENADDDSEISAQNISGEQSFSAPPQNFDERQPAKEESPAEENQNASKKEIYETAPATNVILDWELDDINLLELPVADDEFFDFQDETIDEINPINHRDEPEDVKEETVFDFQEPKYNQNQPEKEQPEEQQPETSFAVSEFQTEEPPENPIRQNGDTQINNGAEMSAAVTEQAQAANISPEIIDAIAAKVIEKLSDKVIREIAWEVVPQMADLIVQKMAREKLNK